MSVLDLSRFSYQRRKKESLLKFGKENRWSPQPSCATTPNKASAGSDSTVVISVPESPPDSFRSAPAPHMSSERIGIPKTKRRNRCRLHGSSEDEVDSGNLFSGLKVSKRRKRDPNENTIGLLDNRSEIVEVSSDEELEHKRSKFPGRKSDDRTRALNLVSKKKKYAGLERCSAEGDKSGASGHGGASVCGSASGCGGAGGRGSETTNGWLGRTTRRGDRDSELHQLSEMFPQHSEGYLRSALEQSASLSEAIAAVLAAVDGDDEQRESYQDCLVLQWNPTIVDPLRTWCPV